jgi:hypothetical protein
MIPKKDGSWRPCGVYHRLNLITTPDKYPLPNMQDLTDGFFKNQFGERLSPNPHRTGGHPKNSNYNAIWLV